MVGGGAARAWFDRLRAGGWPEVERLVAEQQPETLHIDFKAKRDPGTGPLDRDDRRNLSEALSGFANSDGGVLVWGIDARPGDDRVDRVQGFARIEALSAFRAALEGEPADTVAPLVPGLEFLSIPDPSNPESGVVVCLVPASDGGPHMAIGPKLHRYYRRNASSFVQMEHFEVADMFGRRARPALQVVVDCRVVVAAHFDQRHQFLVEASVSVGNAGRGPAERVFLTVPPPGPGWEVVPGSLWTPFTPLEAPNNAALRVMSPPEMLLFQGDSYPGMRFRLQAVGENQAFDLDLHALGHCPGAQTVRASHQASRATLEAMARAEMGGKHGSFGWVRPTR